jgi:hypothetical protein
MSLEKEKDLSLEKPTSLNVHVASKQLTAVNTQS